MESRARVILQFFWATVLLCAAVVIHAVGTLTVLRRVRRHHLEAELEALHRPLAALVVGFLFVFMLHIAEVALWAGAYRLLGAFDTFEEALYFSVSSFTTVGYGDVVLPRRWRLLGASEALVGMFLLGWSVGLVLLLLERLNRQALETE